MKLSIMFHGVKYYVLSYEKDCLTWTDDKEKSADLTEEEISKIKKEFPLNEYIIIK